MIVCPRCGKENQDHYKFCLGCGAELPRDAAHAPKSFNAPTPAAGVAMPAARPPAPAPAPAAPAPAPGFGPPPGQFGGAAAQFGGAAAAAPVPAADGPVVCPKCSTPNSRGFKFCGSCGTPLGAPAPAAPVAAAPAPVAAAPMASGAKRGSLVLIRPDGSEGDTVPFSDGQTIGRETGGLFGTDAYLSPRHATFTFGPGGLTVKDEASLNGVYLRIPADQAMELRDGAVFRIGQEIIRFERLKTVPAKSGVEVMGAPSTGLAGRICLIIGRETTGNCYAIPSSGLHLGRERGDLLFPEDGYVSGLHCRLHEEGGRMMVTDVGSSNGTFLRLTAPTPLPSGSLILLGQQLFRVEY